MPLLSTGMIGSHSEFQMTELISSHSRLLIHVFRHEACNTESVKIA
jgi:hypothetical protein